MDEILLKLIASRQCTRFSIHLDGGNGVSLDDIRVDVGDVVLDDVVIDAGEGVPYPADHTP